MHNNTVQTGIPVRILTDERSPMHPDIFYPSETNGADIQNLLSKDVGAVFKKVWDAPEHSPETLERLAHEIAGLHVKEEDSDSAVVHTHLRAFWLDTAMKMIQRDEEAFHSKAQAGCLIYLIGAGRTSGRARRECLQRALSSISVWQEAERQYLV